MIRSINKNLSKSLAQNDVSDYFSQIRKFPLLSKEEESNLADDWIKNQSLKAAHKLINSHLRLVVKIAMKFRGYGLPLGELISEGNVGMIQSLKRFDPSKGFRLSTYAMSSLSRSPEASAFRITADCDGPFGAVRDALFPS